MDFLQKIGPIAVVAAVFTWCCWPYISGSATATGSGEEGAVITIAKKFFSPKVSTTHGRDPFQSVQDAAEEFLSNSAMGTSNSSTSSRTNNNRTDTAKVQIKGFLLNGTYVQGDRRMAIINSTLYRVGEYLDDTDTPGKKWKLLQIYPDRVVLGCGKQTKVVGTSYASTPSPTQKTTSSTKSPTGSSNSTNNESSLKEVTSLSELLKAVQNLKQP